MKKTGIASGLVFSGTSVPLVIVVFIGNGNGYEGDARASGGLVFKLNTIIIY